MIVETAMPKKTTKRKRSKQAAATAAERWTNLSVKRSTRDKLDRLAQLLVDEYPGFDIPASTAIDIAINEALEARGK